MADAGIPVLILDWVETGGSGVRVPVRRGFGTEVLEAMLAYDLGARTAVRYAPDGDSCTIRLPLTARIGQPVIADAAGDPEPAWDDEIR